MASGRETTPSADEVVDETGVPVGTARPATAPPDRPERLVRRRWAGRVKELAIRLLPIVVLIGIWWLATTTVLTPPRIYPPVDVVWDELVRIVSGEGPIGSTYQHAGSTLYRLVTSFVIAFVLGTLLGVLAGRVKATFDFFDNLVWIAMAVPSVVWVFIFVIALGISDAVPIAALVVLLAPPVLIAVAEGTKSIPEDLLTMARSYKATGLQRLTGLYLPSVVPYMAASARVTFALGIKIVIIAEVIGLPDGVGLLLKYWNDSSFMGPVVAWGVLLIILGLTADRLVFGPLERRASRWAIGDTRIERAFE